MKKNESKAREKCFIVYGIPNIYKIELVCLRFLLLLWGLNMKRKINEKKKMKKTKIVNSRSSKRWLENNKQQKKNSIKIGHWMRRITMNTFFFAIRFISSIFLRSFWNWKDQISVGVWAIRASNFLMKTFRGEILHSHETPPTFRQK